MSQPFEARPFQAIKVPDWVKADSRLRLHTLSDGSARAGRGGGARGDDQRDGVRRPVLRLLRQQAPQKRSPQFPPGRLEKEIAEYKRLGVRILGVYPPCLQGEVYETHPEWRRIATNTTEIPRST